MNIAIVCVGSGDGSRYGADKLEETLGNRTVFATALARLSQALPDAPAVVVVPEGNITYFFKSSAAGDHPPVEALLAAAV